MKPALPKNVTVDHPSPTTHCAMDIALLLPPVSLRTPDILMSRCHFPMSLFAAAGQLARVELVTSGEVACLQSFATARHARKHTRRPRPAAHNTMVRVCGRRRQLPSPLPRPFGAYTQDHIRHYVLTALDMSSYTVYGQAVTTLPKTLLATYRRIWFSFLPTDSTVTLAEITNTLFRHATIEHTLHDVKVVSRADQRHVRGIYNSLSVCYLDLRNNTKVELQSPHSSHDTTRVLSLSACNGFLRSASNVFLLLRARFLFSSVAADHVLRHRHVWRVQLGEAHRVTRPQFRSLLRSPQSIPWIVMPLLQVLSILSSAGCLVRQQDQFVAKHSQVHGRRNTPKSSKERTNQPKGPFHSRSSPFDPGPKGQPVHQYLVDEVLHATRNRQRLQLVGQPRKVGLSRAETHTNVDRREASCHYVTTQELLTCPAVRRRRRTSHQFVDASSLSPANIDHC